jgi:hypothetical protein
VSDRIVRASLTSFAVRPQSTFRFYATSRTDGAPLPAAEVWRALSSSGFGRDLQLWPSGAPADWPSEDVPPLSEGQVAVRGQGTYSGSRMPTVIVLASGLTLQIWSVWEHADAASGQDLHLAEGFSAAAPLGLLLLGLVGLAVAAPRRGRKSLR